MTNRHNRHRPIKPRMFPKHTLQDVYSEVISDVSQVNGLLFGPEPLGFFSTCRQVINLAIPCLSEFDQSRYGLPIREDIHTVEHDCAQKFGYLLSSARETSSYSDRLSTDAYTITPSLQDWHCAFIAPVLISKREYFHLLDGCARLVTDIAPACIEDMENIVSLVRPKRHRIILEREVVPIRRKFDLIEDGLVRCFRSSEKLLTAMFR
ncbi:MAG: hypothetical protein AABW79_03110 [Nanoarchaeota archaeon]